LEPELWRLDPLGRITCYGDVGNSDWLATRYSIKMGVVLDRRTSIDQSWEFLFRNAKDWDFRKP
jgi:hypothetical protein